MNNHENTQIVGILNLSPESFGSEAYSDIPSILKKVKEMIDEGADWIDVGAQSTKPGAIQLTIDEELKRLTGVIKSIKKTYPHILVSIDTTRSECVEHAIKEGVDMINDISGGRFDSNLLQLIAKEKIKYVLTHSQGTFNEIHSKYVYKDIISEVKKYFEEKTKELMQIGLVKEQIVLDPGIGFSKSGNQNVEILQRLEELHSLDLPLYIGVSRKKFIGTIIEKENPLERDLGTALIHYHCLQKGVRYIRTHNVGYTKETIQIYSAINTSSA